MGEKDYQAYLDGGPGPEGYDDPPSRPDAVPCPAGCGLDVARVLVGGHLAVHMLKGDRQLTEIQRVHAQVAIDRGQLAPQQAILFSAADWRAREQAVDRASRRYRAAQHVGQAGWAIGNAVSRLGSKLMDLGDWLAARVAGRRG